MTDSARVTVAGLPRLRRKMREFAGDVEDLKTANATVATLVSAAAAARAPRRSGKLAGSLRGNRNVSRASVTAGGASLPYAGPVHWGWPARHIDGQPFISDAAVATEPSWLPIYERDISRALDKVGGTY